MTDRRQPGFGDPGTGWRDLIPGAELLPDWLPRIALADLTSRELLIVGEDSAGTGCLPGGHAAVLAQLAAGGAFQGAEPDAAGQYLLRPEVREAMLAELRLDDPDLVRTRSELLTAGLARRYPALAVQLANWAFGARDWRALELLWRTYSPSVLLTDARVRAAYLESPPERRRVLPGLSYGRAVTAAFDPTTGRVDLDRLITDLIRDGRSLHARWEAKETPDARVSAGTLWMLAQATIPETIEDPRLDGASSTYRALAQEIREASLHGGAVSARTLTFYHSIASLAAMLRTDWVAARRDAELAMILTDTCGFAGFVAALVVATSSSASGNTQYAWIAEKYLDRHAEHQCKVAAWMSPAFRLPLANAALRRLDRELADRHLRLHEADVATARWFNVRPMHAMLTATYGMVWDDPRAALARFDAIVGDSDLHSDPTRPWSSLLLRCRAELLLSMGELVRAEPMIRDLLARSDASISVVPAARLQLRSGNYELAISNAEQGIFSLDLSLADRAHLYAVKAAALRLDAAPADQVAAAATAACVVAEQASTLLPFAMLPAAVRTLLVEEHAEHHDGADCPVAAARRRGIFAALRSDAGEVPVRVRLTRREEVLLPLLATSATVQEIADQQFVSVNTVRKQVVALREKFGAATRGELVQRARDAGLLSLGS